MSWATNRREVSAVVKEVTESTDDAKQSADFSRYALDPVGYARDVHGLALTPKQEEILLGLITPPYRVLAPSANTQGKSFIGALAVSWWYDTRPVSISITTANTQAQVEEILWGYIRDQRFKAGLGGFKSAVAPRLWSSPTHWARGYTANTGTSFHGRHNERVLIVIDEAVEIGNDMLIAAESMLQGEEYAFLCLYNPTDPTSIMQRLEGNTTGYRIVRLSAMEHPNIIAELAGQPRPFPGAVTLDWVRNTILTHSEEIPPPDAQQLENLPKNIIQFEGKWYRLEGEVEARVFGNWPSEGEFSVWSQLIWDKVCNTELPFTGDRFQIGVDVAWYGRDRTVFAARRGGTLFSLKSVQGWHPEQTHDYAKALAWEIGTKYKVNPKQIPIVVDDIGLGGKVMQAGDRFNVPHDGYDFQGLSVAEKALDEEHYPNKRSELWIELAYAARDGRVTFKPMSKAILHDLKNQFFAAKYTFRGKQKVVEKKEKQKEYLGGRSPDEADAIMLAFADVGGSGRVTERVIGRVSA